MQESNFLTRLFQINEPLQEIDLMVTVEFVSRDIIDINLYSLEDNNNTKITIETDYLSLELWLDEILETEENIYEFFKREGTF